MLQNPVVVSTIWIEGGNQSASLGRHLTRNWGFLIRKIGEHNFVRKAANVVSPLGSFSCNLIDLHGAFVFAQREE